MRTRWVLVATVIGVGCNTPERGQSQGPAQGEVATVPPADALQISLRNPDRVAGRLQRGPVTLAFDARLIGGLAAQAHHRQSSVRLTRGDGTELLRIEQDGAHTRMSVVTRLETRAPAGATQTRQVEARGDTEAFAQLVDTAEFPLLEALPGALERLGVDGSAYPAAQPLHELGAHARQLLASRQRAKVASAARKPCPGQQCGTDEFWDEQSCSCQPVVDPNPDPGPVCNPRQYSDLRSDPCKNECRGMCGPKCTCWPWVCGGCGYNAGCALHDDMCDVCYDSYGIVAAACAVCLTPLAAVVAEVGCGR
jgi:hypothetical protein